jgi:hypothetical protein
MATDALAAAALDQISDSVNNLSLKGLRIPGETLESLAVCARSAGSRGGLSMPCASSPTRVSSLERDRGAARGAVWASCSRDPTCMVRNSSPPGN